MEYAGIWRAKVIENDDSMEEDRYYGTIKVRVPELHGEDTPKKLLPWADPLIPFGQGQDIDGYDYCSLNIPKKDTYVWVFFEKGSPGSPVYFGSWIGGEESELPDDFKHDGSRSSTLYPDIRGFKHEFENGSWTFRVVDDRRVEIKYDDESIIELDSEGDSPNKEPQIRIESDWLVNIVSDTKIQLDASELEITADSITIDANGQLELKGTSVVVDGSAIRGKGSVKGSFAHPER